MGITGKFHLAASTLKAGSDTVFQKAARNGLTRGCPTTAWVVSVVPAKMVKMVRPVRIDQAM
jgi:hypothetical protein